MENYKIQLRRVEALDEKIEIYDKGTFHLPRHSSFMIMHTFADWGNTGQNMAERLGITTV